MTFQDFVFQVADFMGKLIIYNCFFFTVTISNFAETQKKCSSAQYVIRQKN